MVRFVVRVVAPLQPTRHVRVVVDSAAPEQMVLTAWPALYPDTPIPKRPEWQHLDGDMFDPMLPEDMEILQVMADCQLRAGMSALTVHLRMTQDPFPSSDAAAAAAAAADVSGTDHSRGDLSEPMTMRNFRPDGAEMPVPGSASGSLNGTETLSAIAVRKEDRDNDLAVAVSLAAEKTTSRIQVTSFPSSVDAQVTSSFVADDPTYVPPEAALSKPQPFKRGLTTFWKPGPEIPPEEVSDCLPFVRKEHWLNRSVEMLSLIVILVSVGSFILETLPQYRLVNTSSVENNVTVWKMKERTDNHPTFFVIESCCIAYFTTEFLWRLLISTNRLRFMMAPLNIIDLIAILPYYATLGLGSSDASSIAIVRILRLTRISRLAKVSRHSQGLQDMMNCISQTRRELVLFFIITSTATILFASAVYFLEKDEEGTLFTSIPASFWYAIITMTTVGYGDITPVTVGGKIVGAICASLGVVMLAIPAGIFISEFMRLHQERKRTVVVSNEEDPMQLIEIYLSDALEVLADLRLLRDRETKDDAEVQPNTAELTDGAVKGGSIGGGRVSTDPQLARG